MNYFAAESAIIRNFDKLATFETMSKINSPSSNNSGTSSETSDTQSVEDINASTPPAQATHPSTRIPKSWKRMKDPNNDKDPEVKRPPWRAVSVSTLPKPDKSALLRAKLLDASRRLRAAKSSVAVQTDLQPTKLLKEANLGVQTDLVPCREIGMLTDGSYTKRKQGTDQYILTYAVSQMTEAVQVMNMATQTLLPKVPGDDFMQAYQSFGNSAMQTAELTHVEHKLLEQISLLRNTQLLGHRAATQTNNSVNADKVQQDDAVAAESSSTETDTDTSATVKVYSKKPTESGGSTTAHRPTLLKPTLASWHFEYEAEGSRHKDDNFQPYIISPHTPWRSFTPLPLAISGGYYTPGSADWRLFLLAIDELIQESNRLVDLVEDISARQLEQQNVMDQVVPPFQPQSPLLPSEYWLPIIEQQERELNDLLSEAEPPKASKRDK